MSSAVQRCLKRNRDIEPEAALAAAVIEQAIDDALRGCDDAQRWLRSDVWIEIWCDLAGVDVAVVRAVFERSLAKC